jgi:hypothetical protein
MGEPKGRNAWERMRQSFRSSIRRWTNSPWRTIQRFNELRRVSDRRPDGSEIFADLDQERRHASEMCGLAFYERRIKREAKLARHRANPHARPRSHSCTERVRKPPNPN